MYMITMVCKMGHVYFLLFLSTISVSFVLFIVFLTHPLAFKSSSEAERKA